MFVELMDAVEQKADLIVVGWVDYLILVSAFSFNTELCMGLSVVSMVEVTIFSRESDSKTTNVRPFVRLSVSYRNPLTA